MTTSSSAAAGAAVGTLYSQLSPISFSEFTPSRVTRVSNNPFLQEHSPFSINNNIVATSTAAPVPPYNPQRISFHSSLPTATTASTTATPVSLSSQKYVQLSFDSTLKPSQSEQEDCYSTIRRYQRPEGSFKPESVLGYTADSLEEEEGDKSSSGAVVIRQSGHMDRPISFALAIEENPISMFDITGGSPQASNDRSTSLPPDLPPNDDPSSPMVAPDLLVSSMDSSMYRNITGPVPSPRPRMLPINDPVPHDNNIPLSSIDYYNIPTPSGSGIRDYRRSSSDGPVHHQLSSFTDDDIKMPFPLVTGKTNNSMTGNSCSMENLLTDNNNTKQQQKPSLLQHLNSSSTPNLPRLADVSKDEDYGRFTVVYLGKMEIDCYTNCIDKCAKKMLDPKSPVSVHSSEVIVDIMSSRVRLLKPSTGMLLISIPVRDLFASSQCTKNKRLVGVIVWKRNCVEPVCHLFRCSDQQLSNTLLDSLTSVKQDADCLQMGKLSQQHQSGIESSSNRSLAVSLSDSSVGDVLHKWPAVHVATVRVGKSLASVSSIIKKALADYRPSQSTTVSVWVSMAQIRLVQTMDRKQVIYGQHAIRSMEAIGTDNNDQRLVGYIINEKDKPLIAYVVLCYSLADAGALVNFLRDVCQSEYQLKTSDQDTGRRGVSPGGGGLLSLFRSIKPTARGTSDTAAVVGSSPSGNTTSTSPLSSSFQSYVSSQQITSSMVSDIPLKRKNCVVQPSPLQSSFDSTDDDFAKFSVTYVGSANLEGPFGPSLITEALVTFREGGVASGMAPIAKNSVTMQVSALGINLSDKKHKMFINRNYPQKQIIGYASLPIDSQYFGFATLRPGFKDHLRVHVFISCDLPTEQILYAMQYWLNMTPTI